MEGIRGEAEEMLQMIALAAFGSVFLAVTFAPNYVTAGVVGLCFCTPFIARAAV